MAIFIITAVVTYLTTYLFVEFLFGEAGNQPIRPREVGFFAQLLFCITLVFLVTLLAVLLLGSSIFGGHSIDGVVAFALSSRFTEFLVGLVFGVTAFYWSRFLTEPELLQLPNFFSAHFTWAAFLIVLFVLGITGEQLSGWLSHLGQLSLKTPAAELSVNLQAERPVNFKSIKMKELDLKSGNPEGQFTADDLQTIIALPRKMEEQKEYDKDLSIINPPPMQRDLRDYLSTSIVPLANCLAVAEHNQIEVSELRGLVEPVVEAYERTIEGSAQGPSLAATIRDAQGAIRKKLALRGNLFSPDYRPLNDADVPVSLDVRHTLGCLSPSPSEVSGETIARLLKAPHLDEVIAVLADFIGNPELGILILENHAAALESNKDDSYFEYANMHMHAVLGTLYSRLDNIQEFDESHRIRAIQRGQEISKGLWDKASQTTKRGCGCDPHKIIVFTRFWRAIFDNNFAYYAARSQNPHLEEPARIAADRLLEDVRDADDLELDPFTRAQLLDTVGFVKLAYAAASRDADDVLWSEPAKVRNEVHDAAGLFERALMLSADSRDAAEAEMKDTNALMEEVLFEKEAPEVTYYELVKKHRDLALELLAR